MLNLFKAVNIHSDIIQNASYCTDGSKIYRIGGNKINGELINKVYEYIPNVDKHFREVATLPKYLTYAGSFIVHNTLYVVGGLDNKGLSTNNVYSIKLNNIMTSQWKEEKNYPESTLSISIAITAKNVFTLGSGWSVKDKGSNKIYKAVFKNEELDHWQMYLELPMFFTFTSLLNKNNNLILIGGYCNNQENDTVYIVDTKITHRELKIYSSEKANHFYYTAVSTGGDVFKIGGITDKYDGNYDAILSIYKMYRFDSGLNHQTTRWEKLSLIPRDLTVNKALIIKGTVYAFPEHTTVLNNLENREGLTMYAFEINKPYSGIQQRKS